MPWIKKTLDGYTYEVLVDKKTGEVANVFHPVAPKVLFPRAHGIPLGEEYYDPAMRAKRRRPRGPTEQSRAANRKAAADYRERMYAKGYKKIRGQWFSREQLSPDGSPLPYVPRRKMSPSERREAVLERDRARRERMYAKGFKRIHGKWVPRNPAGS